MEPQDSFPHSQASDPDIVLIQSTPPHSTPCMPILILSSHLRLSFPSGLFPLGLPIKSLYASILYPKTSTCPAHLIFDLFTWIIFGEQYKSWSSSLCSPLHSPVTSSHLGSNILLSTVFSNAISLCSSLDMRDQVSHLYKQAKLKFCRTQSLYVV